ncbi:MAG: hypothetical protein AAGA86_01910 [Bacteroidota bacterium]
MKPKFSFIALALTLVFSCKPEPNTNPIPEVLVPENAQPSVRQIMEERKARGFQVFDYVDEATQDTILMQQYYMAFLKKGPKRITDKAKGDSLQMLHLAHLTRMYELGYTDISGPFGDDGDIRGVTIYNTPTLEMADSLAHLDPMVKTGHLAIEIHPWWAARGFPLR